VLGNWVGSSPMTNQGLLGDSCGLKRRGGGGGRNGKEKKGGNPKGFWSLLDQRGEGVKKKLALGRRSLSKKPQKSPNEVPDVRPLQKEKTPN